jgi:4-amino-4-deoxy-L-arabinose transferase-like glycosyltransferase
MNYRRKLIALLVFHIAWAFVLWLSISKYGLGVSTDSVAYMFAGVNLGEGKGLVSYDSSPFYLWPPLYPMLVGFVHLFGFNAFAAAHIIQFTAFALTAYFSSMLFLKIFDDFALAFLAAFLLSTGPVVISSFHMVGPDYLFILFPILLTLLIGKYANSQKATTLILIGLIASLGMLLRYIGYTLVLAGLLAVIRYTSGSALKRILRAASVGLFAIPPCLWMLYTWMATNGYRRAPLALFDYIKQFTSGVLEWFMVAPNYPDVNAWQLAVVWIPIILCIIFAFILARKVSFFTSYTTPILAHGLLYTIFIFINASIAYFNRLDGRFLLPVYLPLVLLLLLIIQHSRSRSLTRLAVFFVILITVFQLQRGVTLMRESVNGTIPNNAYNTREWNENTAMNYWKENSPQGNFILLSNYDAGVAFHTNHITLASPRKTEIYGTEIIPLSIYEDELFEPDMETYLIWIEPNEYKHVYEPLELNSIAKIERLFKNKDGAVFRLTPVK